MKRAGASEGCWDGRPAGCAVMSALPLWVMWPLSSAYLSLSMVNVVESDGGVPHGIPVERGRVTGGLAARDTSRGVGDTVLIHGAHAALGSWAAARTPYVHRSGPGVVRRAAPVLAGCVYDAGLTICQM